MWRLRLALKICIRTSSNTNFAPVEGLSFRAVMAEALAA